MAPTRRAVLGMAAVTVGLAGCTGDGGKGGDGRQCGDDGQGSYDGQGNYDGQGGDGNGGDSNGDDANWRERGVTGNRRVRPAVSEEGPEPDSGTADVGERVLRAGAVKSLACGRPNQIRRRIVSSSMFEMYLSLSRWVSCWVM